MGKSCQILPARPCRSGTSCPGHAVGIASPRPAVAITVGWTLPARRQFPKPCHPGRTAMSPGPPGMSSRRADDSGADGDANGSLLTTVAGREAAAGLQRQRQAAGAAAGASRSPSPWLAPASTSRSPSAGLTGTPPAARPSAPSPAWTSSAPTHSYASGSASWPTRATAPGPSQTGCTRGLPSGQGTPAHRDQRHHPAVAPARLSPGRSSATASSRCQARNPAPTSGGWTTWPPSSPCRPSPCTVGSVAAGSAPARGPGNPKGVPRSVRE
jgi:hypothetical protein